MTDLRSKVLEKMNRDREKMRRALVDLRDLMFGRTGEPDEQDDAWEREAWKIIARALEGKP